MPVRTNPPPSIDRLRELFSYDPATGLFTRIVKRQYPAGTVAGTKDRNGYIQIKVDRRSYPAHRLAWFWVYGTFPPEIDHINRDRPDNRIANLRPASRALNMLNSELRVANRSGITGVSRYNDSRRRRPWRAHITVNSKMVLLGYFETKEEAAAARNVAFQSEMTKRLFRAAEEYHNAAA